jgi:hypothetical protein
MYTAYRYKINRRVWAKSMSVGLEQIAPAQTGAFDPVRQRQKAGRHLPRFADLVDHVDHLAAPIDFRCKSGYTTLP